MGIWTAPCGIPTWPFILDVNICIKEIHNLLHAHLGLVQLHGFTTRNPQWTKLDFVQLHGFTPRDTVLIYHKKMDDPSWKPTLIMDINTPEGILDKNNLLWVKSRLVQPYGFTT